MTAPRDLAAEARSKADALRTNGRQVTALLLTDLADEIEALRTYVADHAGRCDTLCPRCGVDIGLKRCEACGRPRFSDRHLAQVTRDRDRANVVLAHIVESLDADEDMAWEHLPDAVRDLRTQRDRVTDLFETWAAEENEHRLANEFGIAEGLKVAIEGLREAVHGQVTE